MAKKLLINAITLTDELQWPEAAENVMQGAVQASQNESIDCSGDAAAGAAAASAPAASTSADRTDPPCPACGDLGGTSSTSADRTDPQCPTCE